MYKFLLVTFFRTISCGPALASTAQSSGGHCWMSVQGPDEGGCHVQLAHQISSGVAHGTVP